MEVRMRFPTTIAASLLLVVGTIVIPKQRTFSGEIMDSQCGGMGLHGIVNPLKPAKECTIDCVGLGGRYVLYDAGVQMSYGLDDQRKPEAFAGERVEVTGTVDNLAHVIHVIDIRSAQ
jgi:hypothetical protein